MPNTSNLSSESGEVDPSVLESTADRKNKQRRAKRLAAEERKKIKKIATSCPLPHANSLLSGSVTKFVKFMIGLENAKSPLPAPLSVAEVTAWTNNIDNRESLVASKLPPDSVSQTHATQESGGMDVTPGNARANMNYICNQKISELQAGGIPLVQYTPAPETLWNTATALLLIDNWSGWYKTQQHNLKDLDEDIQGIIERWLGSMRVVYMKQLKSQSRSNLSSANCLPEPSTSLGQLSKRRNHRKKIAKRRYAAAKAIFPKNSGCTVLFKDVSSIFTQVAHQLDEAAKQLEKNSKIRANLENLLCQGKSKDESSDAKEPMEAPERFPLNLYNPIYYDRLALITQNHLKPKDNIGLQMFFDSICKQTTPSYMNTDDPPIVVVLHGGGPSKTGGTSYTGGSSNTGGPSNAGGPSDPSGPSNTRRLSGLSIITSVLGGSSSASGALGKQKNP
ncbi:hypothetical protein PCASD_18427 [Puccinia coronata f. sp. avenae]|uniref:Uncharacterized protein n=1 Tax=Puccinia coronata f. sp. avenae TaxID=200324 RepID=A0A2N5TZ62_9BASI|nr:hypothetical protein PCASD_18427 [Puccinia coronata f. sp. avenae]